MNKIYRHGEIGLELINKLPKDLVESKTDIIMKGSHQHNHTFKGGKLYLKKEDEYVFGYLEAKNTKLFHDEHSPKGAKIEDGIYRLRKQVEFVNGELKQVVD